MEYKQKHTRTLVHVDGREQHVGEVLAQPREHGRNVRARVAVRVGEVDHDHPVRVTVVGQQPREGGVVNDLVHGHCMVLDV